MALAALMDANYSTTSTATSATSTAASNAISLQSNF